MMKITYQRNMRDSLMIAEGKAVMQPYEEEMLKENTVPVLLSFYTMSMNGCLQFRYDITGKTSLRDFAEEDGLSVGTVTAFFQKLEKAFSVTGKYLLDPENIRLSPDTVFVERYAGDFKLFLSYMPFEREDGKYGLSSIARFFTDCSKKGDMRLTELLYRLYDVTLKEPDSFESVMKVLSEYEEREEIKEVKERRPMIRDQPKVSDCSDVTENEDDLEMEDYEKDEEDSGENGEEEDYEEEGFVSRLFKAVREKFKKKAVISGKKAGRRLLELFPQKRREPERLDFVYEETDSIEKPTVLMTASSAGAPVLSYEGNGRGRDYPITGDIFRIGSEKGNDAVIESPVVSRHHAKIVRQGEDYFIQDLNSKNGTFVNGKLLSYREAMRLKRDDRIIFADVCYRLV